jgi:hypothetical protein
MLPDNSGGAAENIERMTGKAEPYRTAARRSRKSFCLDFRVFRSVFICVYLWLNN